MLSENTVLTSSQSCCKECHAELLLDVDTGEKICSTCGIVNGEIEADYTAPVSAPTELGSILGQSVPSAGDMRRPPIHEAGMDAGGNRLSGGYELDRLRKLNMMVMGNDSRIRNFRRAMREIRRLTSLLGLGETVADAAFQIYRKGASNGRTRGRSIVGIAGAAVYLACRNLNVPRSAEEIENVAESRSHRSIRRYSKILQREAKIVVDTPDPASCVSRIAKQAGLGGTTERRAIHILNQVKDTGMLAGKRPVSIAAAALYVASGQTGEHITKLRIAFAAEITTITLRKRSLEILQLMEESGQPSMLVAPLTN